MVGPDVYRKQPDPPGRGVLLASNCLYQLASMTKGDIDTVAGNGTPGYARGVPAASAEIDAPQGVAVDHAYDVLVADTENDTVDIIPVQCGGLLAARERHRGRPLHVRGYQQHGGAVPRRHVRSRRAPRRCH